MRPLSDGDREILAELERDAREFEEAFREARIEQAGRDFEAFIEAEDADDDWDGGYVSREAQLADMEAILAHGETCDLIDGAIASCNAADDDDEADDEERLREGRMEAERHARWQPAPFDEEFIQADIEAAADDATDNELYPW